MDIEYFKEKKQKLLQKKQELYERQRELINCEVCNVKISRGGKSQHEKTNKHKKNIK